MLSRGTLLFVKLVTNITLVQVLAAVKITHFSLLRKVAFLSELVQETKESLTSFNNSPLSFALNNSQILDVGNFFVANITIHNFHFSTVCKNNRNIVSEIVAFP